jgi:hypothetical protein
VNTKRYVLLEADGDVTPDDWEEFFVCLEQKFGKLRQIPVGRNGRVTVVKTNNRVAPTIREEVPYMRVGSRRVRTVLTSGSIGKLKRLAVDGVT